MIAAHRNLNQWCEAQLVLFVDEAGNDLQTSCLFDDVPNDVNVAIFGTIVQSCVLFSVLEEKHLAFHSLAPDRHVGVDEVFSVAVRGRVQEDDELILPVLMTTL